MHVEYDFSCLTIRIYRQNIQNVICLIRLSCLIRQIVPMDCFSLLHTKTSFGIASSNRHPRERKMSFLKNMGSVATGAALLATTAFMMVPNVSEAGFALSSFGTRTAGGDTYLSIPDVVTGTGITQDAYPLDPDNFFKYRVRVFHDDATFPNLGWASDSFDPTDETEEIRIGTWASCQANEILIGSESLDWTDDSKVTVVIQTKACPTCNWYNYAVN